MIYPTTPQQHRTAVTDGIRKFIRLTAMYHSPIHGKWIQFEEDLISALRSVVDAFQMTTDMMNSKKNMYAKRQYSFTEDVKKEMQELLLEGLTPTEAALQRKRNLVMYHFVIVPTIDALSHLSHEDAIRESKSLISNIIAEIETSTVDSHYDDAIVAREQVHIMIGARELERKHAKKSRKSTRDNIQALFY